MATMVAGKIGATISKHARLRLLPPSSLRLFNNTAPPPPPSHLPFPTRTISSAAMTAVEQPPRREPLQPIEPSSKIQKLAHRPFSQPPVAAHPLLLRVKRLSKSAVLPSRASPSSAGYDLSSAKDLKVPARGKVLVPTDLSIAIPEGTYARIAPRSGLALKHAIDVGAGVVDADYRGPVGVILFNHSDVDFEVKVGDRIAQLILEKIATPDVTEVQNLDSTDRGDGGFGSTGV